ncbi:hypothetical protein FHR32_002987 [Streptosporangium album]|uniref:Integral membrane protein n=1 Tax=Streptosporangium album TaxID=47479 RepID=A0A7W7W8U0_9ACTN|nr:hypothetical protein [Streptosporangium album]MBB4938682.1 hypothetical protein [Streptosporangium album]
MVTVDKIGRMSRAAKSAQVAMMIQAMLGLVGIVLLSGFFFGGTVEPESAAGFLVLTYVLGLVSTGLIGWLAFNWDSRKRSIWGAALAVESLLALFSVAGLVLGPESRAADLIDFNLVVPAAVVILLLLPSVRTWFDR